MRTAVQQDATRGSDAGLRRARRRRTIATIVFAAILVLGIAALVANPADRFPVVGIGLILLGGINGAISGGGLWRVIDEQRTREGVRADAASHPAAAHAFDQTNRVVDLGRDSEQPDADSAVDVARRLSSMNAAGIAYSNGTR